MHNPLSVDAVYVLSVQSFNDRIIHIRKQLEKHNIPFEFIYAHDIPEIKSEDLYAIFSSECTLGLPQKSLVLKHLEAWRHCITHGYRRILILEDDVILHSSFSEKLNLALEAMDNLNAGYLLFLGGADTRVPREYFLEKGLIFKNPIATADGYVTDITACERRVHWINQKKAHLPADHLLKYIDQQCGTQQYWTTTALVEQGSVFGLFTSTLDQGRKNNSNTYNLARYRWKIFQRRTLPGWITRIAYHFFKIK